MGAPPRPNETAKTRTSRLAARYADLPPGVRRPIVVGAAAILLPAGAVMLVLPGPGLLVMGAGVALLASEFPAVRKQLRRAVAIANSVRKRKGTAGL